METVKSTYNFVPALEEKDVYKPDWSKQISQDVPFSDGLSGELKIKITAKTPIFVWNGKGKEDSIKQFCHFKNKNGHTQYFIPGTSIKGMLRNVLEIISFSRLNPQFVNNHRYSFRDLTKHSVYMKAYRTKDVCAGWLKENNEGGWEISECDFAHIHQREIDGILSTTFVKNFQTIVKDKTVYGKYHDINVKNKNLTYRFVKKAGNNKTIAVPSSEGELGTIVFTGQSGKRKGKSGKIHEFVFFQNPKGTFQVTQEQKIDFKFIYADNDKNNISKAWEFWREKLREGKPIPVFFTKGEKATIKHFGLSYMYKLPYENSIHDMSPIAEYESQLDLATSIFGHTDHLKDKNYALKGRVMVGHAMGDKTVVSKEVNKEIMSSPKASFAPFYLEKDDIKLAYQKKGTLKGFKRYPVHNTVKTGNYSAKQLGNEKVFSKFQTLDSGSSFTCVIRYHNLKPVELGALISALSFHNQNAEYFHSLGGGKSYGYGKVLLEVSNVDNYLNELQDFEYAMNQFLKGKGHKWIESDQIRELYAMAANPKKATEQNLRYPNMEAVNTEGKKYNEFVKYKNDKISLKPYSNQNGVTTFYSLLTDEYLAERKRKVEQQKKKERIFHEQILKTYQSYIESIKKSIEAFEFDKALADYEKGIELINSYDFISDNFLEGIPTEIENKKLEQIEKEAYQNAINLGTVAAYGAFLKNYPFSEFKDFIEGEVRKLKAKSQIPENILNKDNFKQFANNTDNWVHKLKKSGNTIESAGFLEQHKTLLIKIAKNDKKKSIKEYRKRMNKWYSKEVVEELLREIFKDE